MYEPRQRMYRRSASKHLSYGNERVKMVTFAEDLSQPYRQEFPVTPQVLSVQPKELTDVTFAGEGDLRTTENIPREVSLEAEKEVRGTPL